MKSELNSILIEGTVSEKVRELPMVGRQPSCVFILSNNSSMAKTSLAVMCYAEVAEKAKEKIKEGSNIRVRSNKC